MSAVEEVKAAVLAEGAPAAGLQANPEVATVMGKVTAATTEESRKAAAAAVVDLVNSAGVIVFAYGLSAELAAALDGSAAVKESALVAITAIASSVGKTAAPYLVTMLPALLDKAGDSKSAPVRNAADAALAALIAQVGEWAAPVVFQMLFDTLDIKKTWQTKVAGLKCLSTLNKAYPERTKDALCDIVPAVSGVMNDAKEQVKTAAFNTLSECCLNAGNRDVEFVVPAIISCIARPDEVQECIHKLSATTFVQSVETPVLSILVPLLIRGLRERVTAIKRKTSVILDNMAKLVDNPLDALVFLPRLLPEIERVAAEAADPELRNMASKAQVTLRNIQSDGEALGEEHRVDDNATLVALNEALAGKITEAGALPAIEYVSRIGTKLIAGKYFEANEWRIRAVGLYLAPFLSAAEIEEVSKGFLDRCIREVQQNTRTSIETEEEGEDLCNCEFSLAYGGKILLNNATLRLKRGKRYGLCGPNGAGKSTLMRAISNGQLDGFPPKDELRTVYVEHDIDGSMSDIAVVEFVYLDQELQAMKPTDHETVVKMLESVGFTELMRGRPVGSLSGGWKMKLALARTMLMDPDIMLLDEPTNHLDVVNVAWLENYLVSLKDVSSILVSHDSGFLDRCCTGIIHYESRKLKLYKGNLSEFVKKRPEAKSYYELSNTQFKFTLPEPGYLEGIKTKDRAILKMLKCSYKYPGVDKMTITDVTAYCTLSSRVACVGANGAGKSTMIKVLTGEVEPTEGTVWSHPNLRIAYVAQHAFHHIEQHLDKTPNEYIQWRFAIGEDREGLDKASRQVSKEDALKMAKLQVVDGVKRIVEKLLGRRKLKKSYEYEVQFLNTPVDQNTWMPRDRLEEMGFSKMVNDLDIKEAAAQGLHQKPLTAVNVQKHLENIGLEAEFGTHSQMKGLSGGQKVKVVLAAATWLNPHMLVLDEPTNYLDRDSLGALAGAIKEFGGGVIMISHHSEFTSALCPETWVVADGKVDIKGDPAWQLASSKVKVEINVQDEMIDAFGNVVKIKQPKKKLSNKEKKARDKMRAARKERGEEVTDSEEDL
ncbi:MAG: hypothetical protein WDW36_001768 [Sanguina aurantia]